MRRVPRPALAAVLAVVASAPLSALAAQPDQVGRIERILRLSTDGSSSDRICGPTSDVEVQRRASPLWQDGRCDLPLLREDRIRVRPRTVVRLLIRSPDGDGNLALSADSLFSELGGDEEALYQIRETPERLTGWELVVTRGSLALHWLRGALVLFNSGTRAVVSGTRVVLTASPDGQSGTLHLVEGRVSFPDYPEVTMAAGDRAVLRPGVAPEVLAAAPVTAELLRNTARWSVDDVWRSPFYRSPWFIGGVAAAGAVTAWQIHARRDGGHRGTVIIRLPWWNP